MNEKEQYLDKQCGLNQHSGQVDGHNCLKEKGLEISDKFEKDDDDNDDHDDDDLTILFRFYHRSAGISGSC